MTNRLTAHIRHFAIGALAAALGASAVVIAEVTFSDFTAGTTISAAEMNAKLNALKDAVNASAPSEAGAVYVIPGTGGVSGGGYLELTTPSSRAELSITCNYGFAGDNEAYWFAGNSSVVAGSIAITNRLDGEPLQAFNDLEYNKGGQDRANRAGSAQLGAWPWHGVFTANDGGTLTRWDVTMTGSAGGDCTAVVYASNGGTARIVHP